ncbi:MAG: OsmC family protein [Phycisphaerales bacterium]
MTADPPFRSPEVTVVAHRNAAAGIGDRPAQNHPVAPASAPVAIPASAPAVDPASPYAVGGYARGQPFVSDAKASDGGAGSAISPVDMMLASLGSCTAMTVLMYADRKQWPVDGIRVGLAMERRRATPDERAAGERPGASTTGWIVDIDMTLQIDGDALDSEQLDRMQSMARKCPVHQTIAPGATIRDRLGPVEITAPG